MPASKRRTPNRKDLRWQYRNRRGNAYEDGDPGIDLDPFRGVEVFSEGEFNWILHDWGGIPGTGILFDAGGRELEVLWHDDLSGGTTGPLFNGELADARMIIEGDPNNRHLESFTATSTYQVTHDLGQTPSSVLLYSSSGNELEVAWRDIDANTVRIDFNGAVSGATVLVEGPDPFRHDETFSATSTFRVEHGFGVTPGSVLLFDSSGYEVMVAWQDDGVGEIIDINFNGSLTNARVLVSAIDEEDMTASDYGMEVARGNVAGHTAFHMAGTNTDLDSAGGEIIWNVGDTFINLSAAQTIDVVSDSPLDDNTTPNTGARKVTLYGLDSAYALASEEVEMNGTTTVTTTATFTQVHRMAVTEVGGSQRNGGYITAAGTTDGYDICQIGTTSAGDGESAACLYRVPDATTLYLNQIQASVAKWSPATAQVSVALFVQEFGGAVKRKTPIGTCIVGSTGFPVDLSPPIAVPAKALVYLFAETSIDDTYMHGSMTGVLVAD